MKMPLEISADMLAPCGINCMVCYVHLRPRKSCSGCRCNDDAPKPGHCGNCKIKTCSDAKSIAHCFACDRFPCRWIKAMEKSYKKYGVSPVENGREAQANGIETFMKQEASKWLCECGGIISVHEDVCSECGTRISKDTMNEKEST